MLADDEGSALARALWFRKGTGRDRTHDPPVTWHACRDVGPGIEPRPTDDAMFFILDDVSRPLQNEQSFVFYDRRSFSYNHTSPPIQFCETKK